MVVLERFDELPDELQQQILDRQYSGWALNDHRLAKYAHVLKVSSFLVQTENQINDLNLFQNRYILKSINTVIFQHTTSQKLFQISDIYICLHSVPTTNTERTISLNSGGSKPNTYENDPNLLTFQGMKSAEAFGSVEEMNVTDT